MTKTKTKYTDNFINKTNPKMLGRTSGQEIQYTVSYAQFVAC